MCPKCNCKLRIEEIDRTTTHFNNGLRYSVFCTGCKTTWDTDRPEKYYG